jgi:hypothetical protein
MYIVILGVTNVLKESLGIGPKIHLHNANPLYAYTVARQDGANWILLNI